MITQKLSMFLVIAIVFYFVCIFHLIKRKSLSLKYSLMWLLSGVIILLITIFPEAFNFIMEKIGIVNAANGLFSICVFLLLILLLMLTSIISKMNTKIKTMVQNIGIMEQRIRELEEKNK